MANNYKEMAKEICLQMQFRDGLNMLKGNIELVKSVCKDYDKLFLTHKTALIKNIGIGFDGVKNDTLVICSGKRGKYIEMYFKTMENAIVFNVYGNKSGKTIQRIALDCRNLEPYSDFISENGAMLYELFYKCYQGLLLFRWQYDDIFC